MRREFYFYGFVLIIWLSIVKFEKYISYICGKMRDGLVIFVYLSIVIWEVFFLLCDMIKYVEMLSRYCVMGVMM